MKSEELFERHPNNPILTADDWPYEVNGVFNPTAGESRTSPSRVPRTGPTVG